MGDSKKRPPHSSQKLSELLGRLEVPKAEQWLSKIKRTEAKANFDILKKHIEWAEEIKVAGDTRSGLEIILSASLITIKDEELIKFMERRNRKGISYLTLLEEESQEAKNSRKRVKMVVLKDKGSKDKVVYELKGLKSQKA